MSVLAHAASRADPSPVERARALQADLSRLGDAYDAAPAFPRDSLQSLVDAGLHRTFAPPMAGGDPFDDEEAQALVLLDVLRVIGRADLSVGRIYEGHVNALKLFAWYGSDAQKAWLGKVLADGGLLGVWATEPAPGVALAFENDALSLQGAKSFATGAGGLDWAVVTARPADGPRRLVVVPANVEGRADLGGWRVRGMRATGSGLYDLSGLAVSEADLLGAPGDYDRDPRFTSGAWRFCAVQLGGLEGLLAEMRTGLSDAARQDPIQRARFADAVAAVRTAGFWVREAARRAGREEPASPDFIRLTRGVVERSGLDVMEGAARAVGTRSAFDGQRLDRIIRDLSLYLRQAGPDHARDRAGAAWLERDVWGGADALW